MTGAVAFPMVLFIESRENPDVFNKFLARTNFHGDPSLAAVSADGTTLVIVRGSDIEQTFENCAPPHLQRQCCIANIVQEAPSQLANNIEMGRKRPRGRNVDNRLDAAIIRNNQS